MQKNDKSDAMANHLGEIRSCECGGVELCIGPVALHIAPDEVAEFVELANAAIDMTQHERQRRTNVNTPRRKVPNRPTFH